MSDYFARRGLTMIIFALIATAGFAVFRGTLHSLSLHIDTQLTLPPFPTASFDSHVRYGALFLLVPGGFGIGPPLGTWQANNAAPLARRASALAFTITMTNIGGIFATWLFGTISPAPRSAGRWAPRS